jgi:prepilin peptidase CpaA
MVGSAGGGDVKLMGALSIWRGASLTLKVILASLIFVVTGTLTFLIISVCKEGWKKTRKHYTRAATTGQRTGAKSTDSRSKRRVMAFAMPVALAT